MSNIDVQVYGVEMVYVPQGTFYVGDGSSESTNGYRRSNTGSIAERTPPVFIQNGRTFPEGSYCWNGGPNNETHDITTSQPAANYANGFSAFYMMKYPITQIQYVEFLNTLTRTQQNARVAANISSITSSNRYAMIQLYTPAPDVTPISPAGANAPNRRNGVMALPQADPNSPVEFVCNLNDDQVYNNPDDDGLYIACNFLNVYDVYSYLAWSGLRPMTVMEFEKAARGAANIGQLPTPGEYVWGTTTPPVYLDDKAGFDGSIAESCASSCGTKNQTGNLEGNLSRTNWPDGPVRVGALSMRGNDRVLSGAGYYGGMHMGDNVHDFCVNLFNNSTNPADVNGGGGGRRFNAQHGSGNLLPNGNYDSFGGSWPDPNYQLSAYRGVSIKGSCFFHGDERRQISRHDILDDSNDPNQQFRPNARRSYLGGRGVRSAN
ncbi:MAG: hypothetical protein EA358_03790 [Flavobacteriales bacterium]|nr:MAG: hypothetical protein EA358_03790 [Flavobacteriales bacterium]